MRNTNFSVTHPVAFCAHGQWQQIHSSATNICPVIYENTQLRVPAMSKPSSGSTAG
jgi:hypothetical protein